MLFECVASLRQASLGVNDLGGDAVLLVDDVGLLAAEGIEAVVQPSYLQPGSGDLFDEPS